MGEHGQFFRNPDLDEAKERRPPELSERYNNQQDCLWSALFSLTQTKFGRPPSRCFHRTPGNIDRPGIRPTAAIPARLLLPAGVQAG